MDDAVLFDAVRVLGPLDGRHILVINAARMKFELEGENWHEQLFAVIREHFATAATGQRADWQDGDTWTQDGVTHDIAEFVPMLITIEGDIGDETIRVLDEAQMNAMGWYRR